MKVLLGSPLSGVQGGISRWTEHILGYYKGNCSDSLDLHLLDMGRSQFVNINMPTWKRFYKAFVDYCEIIKEFKKTLKSDKYDLLHLASSASISLIKDYLMVLIAKKYGVKTVVQYHFGRIPDLKEANNWEWKLLVKVIRMADRVVVIDKASFETLISCGFNNISLLPNPVAPVVCDIVEKNKDIVREPRTILFTGHVVKTKGIYELLEACKNLKDIKLKIVGHITDDIRKSIIEQYGTPDWFDICGEMPYESVIKEMMRCDVFVLPTYTEGFPNVILESMASGCAIVSTPVGAIPQMLEGDENGKYGILVPPQDMEKLQTALERVLSDESLKSELRSNAIRRVNERYNIASVWNQMVKIWETL